jgi:predicted nucleic acid-binding protein
MIFDEVILPQSVYNEIIINGKGKTGYDLLSNVKWFQISDVENIDLKKSIMIELDEGEAEVISIAKDKNIPLVCIDEFAGRQYAKLLGLNVIGTLGILLIAKQKGYISELNPLFKKLLANDRYIGEALCNSVLRKAGEPEI